jgi:hypothetical protein
MIQSQLENHEITAFLKDEIVGTLSPWWIASGGAGSVKVIISNSDFDKAMPIVDRFVKLQREITPST